MKILTSFYLALGWISLIIGSFCIGYALSSHQYHVLFLGILYCIVSIMIFRSHEKDEEEDKKHNR